MNRTNRRQFLGHVTAGSLAGGSLAAGSLRAGTRAAGAPPRREYDISLAAWSLHKAFFAHLVEQIDFPRIARVNFGIGAMELVNTMFPSPTESYLNRLKRAAKEHEVTFPLIMVDGEGSMAHPEAARRKQAVKNHHKWVEIAVTMGCKLIRCNIRTGGRRGEKHDTKSTNDFVNRGVESFSSLVEYGKAHEIAIVIENHGGLSSDADVLARVMEGVNSPYFGTLPDFGNFEEGTDVYQSVRKLMKYAKAVSAKCNDFDEKGNETRLDYERLIRIVVDEFGYHGHIGIEYEGSRLSEYEGISACNRLLKRLRG